MKGLSNGAMSCAVNAQACHETERCDWKKDGAGRPVVVIGGGPAGMEAARVLALRGFQVTLLEQADRLGGSLQLAAKPPHKEKIGWLIQYLSRQLEKLHITVQLGTAATPELVESLKPYAVFVAAGASPLIPILLAFNHAEYNCCYNHY